MNISEYKNMLDPIHIVWRKGTDEDPFIERVEFATVVAQRVQLLEIPDPMFRVRIVGMTEINEGVFKKKNIKPNEFFVDYTNGVVLFHRDREATSITLVYRGRGLILYPSSRIYHYDGKSDVVETLKDIINETNIKIEELKRYIKDFENAEEDIIIAINKANTASDNALKASERAENAAALAESAYETTKMIYQPYVMTYDDILTTYPHPKVGWTVQVYDTGIRYRFNGKEWIPIDLLGGSIPLANEQVNGLMSKSDYVKLKNISSNVDTRVIVFFMPQDILTGVQDPHIVFPFDGEIESISATVSRSGSSETAIRIEKSIDYINWDNITPDPLLIPPKEHFSGINYTISDSVVNTGDIFRIFVPYSSDVQNLTVNIEIRIRENATNE